MLINGTEVLAWQGRPRQANACWLPRVRRRQTRIKQVSIDVRLTEGALLTVLHVHNTALNVSPVTPATPISGRSALSVSTASSQSASKRPQSVNTAKAGSSSTTLDAPQPLPAPGSPHTPRWNGPHSPQRRRKFSVHICVHCTHVLLCHTHSWRAVVICTVLWTLPHNEATQGACEESPQALPTRHNDKGARTAGDGQPAAASVPRGRTRTPPTTQQARPRAPCYCR